jgi:hypothetical protein
MPSSNAGVSLKYVSVGRHPFVEARDIGSREARLEMLPKRVVDYLLVMLGGIVQTLLDTLRGYPTKIGFKGLKIKKLPTKLVWMRRHQLVYLELQPSGRIVCTMG